MISQLKMLTGSPTRWNASFVEYAGDWDSGQTGTEETPVTSFDGHHLAAPPTRCTAAPSASGDPHVSTIIGDSFDRCPTRVESFQVVGARSCPTVVHSCNTYGSTEIGLEPTTSPNTEVRWRLRNNSVLSVSARNPCSWKATGSLSLL